MVSNMPYLGHTKKIFFGFIARYVFWEFQNLVYFTGFLLEISGNRIRLFYDHMFPLLWCTCDPNLVELGSKEKIRKNIEVRPPGQK